MFSHPFLSHPFWAYHMFSIHLEESIQRHSQSTDESNDLSSKGTGLVGEIVGIPADGTEIVRRSELSTIAVSSESLTSRSVIFKGITTFAIWTLSLGRSKRRSNITVSDGVSNASSSETTICHIGSTTPVSTLAPSATLIEGAVRMLVTHRLVTVINGGSTCGGIGSSVWASTFICIKICIQPSLAVAIKTINITRSCFVVWSTVLLTVGDLCCTELGSATSTVESSGLNGAANSPVEAWFTFISRCTFLTLHTVSTGSTGTLSHLSSRDHAQDCYNGKGYFH